jgi:hypothetical protein
MPTSLIVKRAKVPSQPKQLMVGTLTHGFERDGLPALADASCWPSLACGLSDNLKIALSKSKNMPMAVEVG